jgi:glutamate formiminotransferase/formiminotetrahydrofolate cyclodeaminase
LKDELLDLVDEDTKAFDEVMRAFGLPKTSDDEKAARSSAIQDATRYAAEVPFRTMERSLEAFEIIQAMAETGNPNSVSDAGVGALCARSAVMGAGLNVRINASSLKDRAFADDILAKTAEVERRAQQIESDILAIVNSKISS